VEDWWIPARPKEAFSRRIGGNCLVSAQKRVKIPLAKPVFDDEMKEAAVLALQNERFVLGESVYKFEEEFSQYIGTKHCISVSSGTAALQLSLIALGVKSGCEVVTSPASFVATGNAVLHAGGSPVFADVTMRNYNLDSESLRKGITKRTTATIPVHLYGFPADMASILGICEDNGIAVIEDACQAHGALYDGRTVGSLGKVGCFSFYPSKCMMVGGDGGAVTTDDEEVARKVAKLRDCGRVSKYIHDIVGFTARLNTVNAAIGRVQLRHLEEWNERRRTIAALYDRLLNGAGDVIVPPAPNSLERPVYYLYVIRTRFRDELKNWLDGLGVETGVHYPVPIHLQPAYRELFGYRGGEFPNSELLCQTALSLPIFPDISQEAVRLVCDEIKAFFSTKELSG
jgi:perosamine synthetase